MKGAETKSRHYSRMIMGKVKQGLDVHLELMTGLWHGELSSRTLVVVTHSSNGLLEPVLSIPH